jgi:hypothetical protein
LVSTLLSWDWLRQIYRIGSYLVVFHEGTEREQADTGLHWITRNRMPKNPMNATCLNHPLGDHGTAAFEFFVLFVLAWLPALFGLSGGYPLGPGELAAVGFSVVESIGVLFVLVKVVRTFPRTLGEMTEAWKRVREAEKDPARLVAEPAGS